MRVLGLARLLRAVCRRWLGGLIVVDDVQLSVFTGELELVDCELDGPKLTKLLARVGLRCRVVNARAAKVSVSLPITWRRGARIRVVVADPGASLELDDAEQAGMLADMLLELGASSINVQDAAAGTPLEQALYREHASASLLS